MSVATERRLVIECAWCRGRYLIPTEWAGTIQTCIHCGREGRCYGYLSAPEHVRPEKQDVGYMLTHDDDRDDCRGGLVSALMVVLGLWFVAGSVIHWVWF